jgi:hypothetical protein
MLVVYYKTIVFYNLLFVFGTQLSLNMVLVFMCLGIYPHGVILQSHLSHFDIPKGYKHSWVDPLGTSSRNGKIVKLSK